MANVKKTPKPDPKPKAVPEKITRKPDLAPQKKAAGSPRKSAETPKKVATKTPSAPSKPKPTVAPEAHTEPVKKPVGQKKPRGKGIVEKAAATQEMAPPSPAMTPTMAPPITPTPATPSVSAKPPAAAPSPLVAATKAVAKDPGLSAAQVEIALRAVKEGKAIELIFTDADTNPPRTFEPRQLIFDTLTQAWFVWGWDRRYNAERHHRLDQMAEINLVDGPGRSAQGPYKEGTPANLIGGWLGGEPIHVKAALQKQWIFAVKQAPPAFPEFKIEDGEEGKATVSFVATDLRAIARWCLQFGEGIQVLEPQRLVDRVKQVGMAWVGKPVAAAPAPTPRPVPQPAPKPEYKPEHKSERKPEYKSEYRREQGKDREEAPKKGARVEIRIEKL